MNTSKSYHVRFSLETSSKLFVDSYSTIQCCFARTDDLIKNETHASLLTGHECFSNQNVFVAQRKDPRPFQMRCRQPDRSCTNQLDCSTVLVRLDSDVEFNAAEYNSCCQKQSIKKENENLF